MTPVAIAFRQWFAAEQDLHDAHRLFLYHLRARDDAAQAAQSACVSILREDAVLRLREYGQVVETHPLARQRKAQPPRLQARQPAP